ncbi:hypothetical protein F5Y06DRAFT_300887 [Hypoxylon sp. FL0890]|nr:hypothetical protein F5Y06DRAFT_300887 [Hypoxylon sp. FL0890]
MPQPCQACIVRCTKDPNESCATFGNKNAKRCVRCNLLEESQCEPPPGLRKEMQSFLNAREKARRSPNDVAVHREFQEAGRCLREAVSKQSNTAEKKEDLINRVESLEKQHSDLIVRVSTLEAGVSMPTVSAPSPLKDAQFVNIKLSSQSIPTTSAVGGGTDLTSLRKEEAELDAALEIARLQAIVSRQRARVEALNQGLPDPEDNEPTPSLNRPRKRQEL